MKKSHNKIISGLNNNTYCDLFLTKYNKYFNNNKLNDMTKPNSNLSLAAGAFEAIEKNDTNKLQTLIDQCPPDITFHIFYITQSKQDSDVFNILRKHLKLLEDKYEDHDLSMEELEAEFKRLRITERMDDPDEQQDSMSKLTP